MSAGEVEESYLCNEGLDRTENWGGIMATEEALRKPINRFLKRERTEYLVETAKDTLDHLKMILIIPPRERTLVQIQTLVSFTKHIRFFSELSDKEGTAAHQQCVQHMFYQSVKEGQVRSS